MRFRTTKESIAVRDIEQMFRTTVPSGVVLLVTTRAIPTLSRLKQIARNAARGAGVRIKMHESMDPPGLRVLVLPKEGKDE